MANTLTSLDWVPQGVPLDRPNVARMYDYFLGGGHNFASDRQAAEQLIKAYPDLPLIMRVNRAFLRRAVAFLVEQHIEQFLDLGSGIPTAGNVHEVAQAANPAARVVYVDIDPVAVAHSRSLLQHTRNTAAVLGDIREPERIINDPDVVRLLDWSRPIAVLMFALLHFIPDNNTTTATIRAFRERMAPGSYLAITCAGYEALSPQTRSQVEALYARAGAPFRYRSKSEIAEFFDGMKLVEPGLVELPLWRPQSAEDLFLNEPWRTAGYGGVAQKV